MRRRSGSSSSRPSRSRSKQRLRQKTARDNCRINPDQSPQSPRLTSTQGRMQTVSPEEKSGNDEAMEESARSPPPLLTTSDDNCMKLNDSFSTPRPQTTRPTSLT